MSHRRRLDVWLAIMATIICFIVSFAQSRADEAKKSNAAEPAVYAIPVIVELKPTRTSNPCTEKSFHVGGFTKISVVFITEEGGKRTKILCKNPPTRGKK